MTHRIDWTCTDCGFPIADNNGAIVALYAEINDPDSTIPWRPMHYGCQGSAEGYQIDVQGIRTHGDVLWWTRHLLPKNWFARSEWSAVISEAIGFEVVA